MLKLWKGLFYCMWMSDKPKVQEELAETIAQLLHSFQITAAAVDYLDGFYKTICREWHGIDRLRLDKFYLLIRKFVYQGIVFLKNHGWKNEVVESFNKMLENGPLSTSNEFMLVPDGVKTHVIQVYFEELLKCETSQIPRSVLLQLVQPFIRLLATSKSKVITKTVSEEIFDELLNNVTEHQDGCLLNVDFQAMNDEFFSWASRKDIPTRNRHILYGYIDKFKVFPKENDCDSSIQQEQVNGLNESTHVAREKCNDSMEASVNNCNSMDIDGDKECKVHTKKIKKGEERKQHDVVEGDARMCDMDPSAGDERVKKKRSRKRRNLSQDCATIANGSKVSVEDSIAIYEDSEMKEEHDKQFMSECVEDSKTGKKVKGRKRKGDSKTGSEENIPTLTEDVKSIKKRKRSKPNGNKLCDETQGGDTVDKHSKKKKNKSVVQDSSEIAPVGNENDVKDKLSNEAEASGNKGSNVMNITHDSLDGSYLSTLPKQAQNVTSLGGNVVKTEVFKKSTVQETNNTKTKIKDTPRIDSSADSLCQSDLRLAADTITKTPEEATEIAKGDDINLTPDSMPLAVFLRHAQKKVKANTEPRTHKERKKMTPRNQASSGKKKKVRIELSKNTSHSTRDYRQILKCSPVVPFDANKKPVQSSLKTPPTSASKPTTASSPQPRKRPAAVDFF